MPGLIDAGQAVSAEAYVDSRSRQPAQGKRVVVEIEVAARTMDDMHLAFGQYGRILLIEIIRVRGQQPLAQRAAAFQVLDRRTQAAVRHVTSARSEEHTSELQSLRHL